MNIHYFPDLETFKIFLSDIGHSWNDFYCEKDYPRKFPCYIVTREEEYRNSKRDGLISLIIYSDELPTIPYKKGDI